MCLEEQDEDQNSVNLILVFGCEPRLVVQAESPISHTLTEHFYSFERKNKGKVKLPEALIFYNHENKIEKTILVTKNIELRKTKLEHTKIIKQAEVQPEQSFEDSPLFR
jgi:hypothetical protein